MKEKITEMTALQLGAAIKEGRVTAVKAAEAMLAAISRKEAAVHSFITVCGEQALERAAEIQRRLEAGDPVLMASPLAGVPMAIKDNICTGGIKTTCGSKMLSEFVPIYDGTVIERLEAAGVVIMGKTNMDEFAMGSTTETSFYGPTRNPWDLTRVPGGSSGGSAAAVAAAQVACALGSDTGGSIRQPAAYCGVTGLKPTYGTVSRYGLIAYASSLDQIGPIAKDVRDCAAIMDLIGGVDEMDGTSLDGKDKSSYLAALTGDIRGMKIGIPGEKILRGVEEDVKQALLEMGDTLKKQGAQIERVDLDFLDYVIPAYYIIAAAEASSNLSRFDGVRYGYRAETYQDLTDMYCRTRAEGFGSEVKKRILLGTFALSSGYYDSYYKKALQVKAVIKREFDRIFKEYDGILLPAAPTTAPKLDVSLEDPLKMYLSDIFTVSANIAGLPALSLPSGRDGKGMPIGTQIIGPALADRQVLNLGYAYQQVTDWHQIGADLGLEDAAADGAATEEVK
jgi:aspartyl-tRNA(Asn)/glutamyl-tRNA(Gln) amidotransferase subunit A